LKIAEDASENTTEYTKKMSIAPANIQNGQAGLPKSMILDPGWFNRDRMKFKD